ncbi:MAG: hypothetical protein JET69_02395 [Methanomassiliicoccales archaeon]|nr:hypothetical protein [Methanomassiliicoccales archaeon]
MFREVDGVLIVISFLVLTRPWSPETRTAFFMAGMYASTLIAELLEPLVDLSYRLATGPCPFLFDDPSFSCLAGGGARG